MSRLRKFKRRNDKIKQKIIKEYSYSNMPFEYREALRIVFSFIFSHIHSMAKYKKVFIDFELTMGSDSAYFPVAGAHLVILSRKQIQKIYNLVIEDKTIDICYMCLLEDINLLPKEKQFGYPMDLYRPTILITAIYLIFGHEATHAFANDGNHSFENIYELEKQCDTSASSMIINIFKNIIATFMRNNLLKNVPRELFEGVLLMNIMIGVLIFTKYIASDKKPETEDYLLHKERRILYLIGSILALPLHSYTTREILCRTGVLMYSKIFEISIEEAENIFNNIAEKFDKLNN